MACDHKFIDSNICLKCGESLHEVWIRPHRTLCASHWCASCGKTAGHVDHKKHPFVGKTCDCQGGELCKSG